MVDVDAQIDAVDRDVRSEEIDGFASRVQTLTQTYPSPIDDVWDAVTTPDRIRRWFMPIRGELHLGGTYQLEGNAGGSVQSCEPPHNGYAHFGVTWEFGGGVTWLTVRLTATSDGSTRLELEHVAHTDDVPDELWAQFGPAATGMGWDSGLLGLSLFLAGGQDGVSPEEAAAWVMTDEGKRFMRRSADGWSAAHEADGADAATAARAADATYAAYTGGPAPMDG